MIRPRLPIWIGLLIAIGIPALAIMRPANAPYLSDMTAAVILAATPFLVLLWVLFGEKRALESIGLRRPTWVTIAVGIAGVAVNVGISVLCGFLFGPEATSTTMTRLLNGPGWLLVILVTSGALLTEIAFRGYAIERISELVGKPLWFGAVAQLIITTALFVESRGLAHGLTWLVDGMAFNYFYIRCRDTDACLIAHAIPNFTASMLIATGIAQA